jgi:hypothetical protein
MGCGSALRFIDVFLLSIRAMGSAVPSVPNQMRQANDKKAMGRGKVIALHLHSYNAPAVRVPVAFLA